MWALMVKEGNEIYIFWSHERYHICGAQDMSGHVLFKVALGGWTWKGLIFSLKEEN